MLRSPIIIYADFECLLENIRGEPTSKRGRDTIFYAKHKPCSAAFYPVASFEGAPNFQFETYTGPNVCNWFLSRLAVLGEEVAKILLDEKRLIMTPEDMRDFTNAERCFICNKPFPTEYSNKVRDHDHLTGRYRGAAHNSCNLNYKFTFKVPVMIHNFRGYDSHLISFATAEFPTTKLHVIGQGYEKYLTLSFGPHIVFKDSNQFLACSLEQLAKNLLKAGGPNKFPLLFKEFSMNSDAQRQLLLRKGIYPYEYMDKWERLDERMLPPIEKFFNSLKQEPCSREDYAHALQVWDEFHCSTLKDYQDLYLKTDVLLLADIFENFREISVRNYQLDPAYYVSSPQLSWDAMLLFTKCELELIADPEMFLMLDQGLRGGVSMITHRFARANNPEMGDLYDPELPLSYIVYLDANNLYGWAMSQPLPITGVKWLKEREWCRIDWELLADDSAVGYFIECDLSYPANLHDAHNDLPLGAEKLFLKHEMLNEHQLRILRHYS